MPNTGIKTASRTMLMSAPQHEPHGSQSGFPVHADEIRERQAARDHRPEKHQAAQIGFGGPPQLFIRPEKAHQFAAEQQHPADAARPTSSRESIVLVKIAEAASGLFSPRYFPARTAPPDASMTPTPKNKENIGMTRLRAAKDIALSLS